MAYVLKQFYFGYNWLFTEIADPRPVELGLLFMSSPLIPVAILSLYLYFVKNLGPKIMENREPFDLKIVIRIYNVLQICLNGYICKEAFYDVWYVSNWDCAEVIYDYDPHRIHVLRFCHLFLLTKFFDLFETIIFVLRKRNKQISFLHVYHHFGMVFLVWVAVKFIGGGHGIWVGLINSFVHTIMYCYYFLTSIDEKWKSSLWFKKMITQIQMIQFLCFIIIYGRIILHPTCGYTKLCCYFFVIQNVFMLLLFSDFYLKAYRPKKKESP